MRVIAGKLRGRPLKAPRGLDTRPTSDRAREAIFQILGNLDGLRVVDCYAGTGAMGIEALSRGALHAVFIEPDRAALQAIKDNVEKLGQKPHATVLEVPVEKARSRLEKLAPFDLVLSDPPWRIAQLGAVAVARLFAGLLADDARVLLGHPAAQPVVLSEDSGLELADRRKWGGSGMSFFEISNKND
ncbi:MAG TPA: 16S rRNA (guanine(966)-N(2))-methyltransferase RsmD [Polyangiaceae bacterium]|nr:16S rRNA (guanine(966)-N(2))-methyltransferase RsmD [Polyangiaceae bacterium]